MRTILLFVAGYLPGYKSGGPVRTVANQIDAVGDEFRFKVVCADRDLGESSPYSSVRLGEWNRVGKAEVFYISKGLRGYFQICKIILKGGFDVLYLNSFFSFMFSIFPIFISRLTSPGVQILLGPRGEFSEGALALKAEKKNRFIKLAKSLGFYRGIAWHASSSYEKSDIQRVFGREERIRVAIDIATRSRVAEPVCRPSDEPLKIVFISRISPKKNLKFAISILMLVKTPVQFDVYGPVEDEAYWRECLDVVATLPKHVGFEYKGSLPPDEVPSVLARYSLFLFPTLGENFGHVIAEALFAGLPVLLSDQTPWRDLDVSGLGWDLPLDNPLVFAEKVDELGGLTGDELLTRRKKVISWAERNIGGDVAIAENKLLFVN